jgi:hypothetical protein
MKKLSIVFMSCLLLVALATNVYAGNTTKTGTAGAMELLIPVGARGIGIAGSSLSLLTGVEAIHYNPAGLARGWEEGSVQGIFSHMEYIASTSLDYAGIAMNLGDLGVVAGTLRSMNFGDIHETTEDLPDGTGRVFSPTYVTLGLSYAKSLTDRIQIGFTAKYVTESILRTSATGFAIDAGVAYHVSGSGPLGGLHFGVALKNLGPRMQYDGADLERTVVPPNSAPGAVEAAMKFTAQTFELPSSFELSVGYDYGFAEGHKLSTNVNFSNMNFSSDLYKAGLEYSWNGIFFLRGGYVAIDGDDEQNVFSATGGAGLQYNFGGFNMAVDYAYMASKVFDGVHVISVRLNM